ncbi:MAG: hypothetical protein ABI411_16340 [Tahibacter sp.]
MRRLVACAALCCLAFATNATDLPRIFMTSVSGSGNLSTWPDAHGQTGLQAADEICRTRAAAGQLADAAEYVALLSDASDDAYCRVHGLSGKRSAQCNVPTLPIGAGPWYRLDDLGAVDVAQNALRSDPDVGYLPRHILYNEFGIALPSSPTESQLAFTATNSAGTVAGTDGTCSNWSSTDGTASLGGAYRGFDGLSAFDWECIHPLRLICLQRGAHGPALGRLRPATARLAFITSGEGNGNLAAWPDAQGATNVAAGDSICRAHAVRASLPMAQTYKAWLSNSHLDAKNRYTNDGAWYRLDGVRFTASIAGMIDGVVDAPLQVDELGRPVPFQNVWTGTSLSGTHTPFTCGDWSIGNGNGNGTMGQSFAADEYWTSFGFGIAPGCGSSLFHLYCLADNDSLFLDGFDRTQ